LPPCFSSFCLLSASLSVSVFLFCFPFLIRGLVSPEGIPFFYTKSRGQVAISCQDAEARLKPGKRKTGANTPVGGLDSSGHENAFASRICPGQGLQPGGNRYARDDVRVDGG